MPTYAIRIWFHVTTFWVEISITKILKLSSFWIQHMFVRTIYLSKPGITHYSRTTTTHSRSALVKLFNWMIWHHTYNVQAGFLVNIYQRLENYLYLVVFFQNYLRFSQSNYREQSVSIQLSFAHLDLVKYKMSMI